MAQLAERPPWLVRLYGRAAGGGRRVVGGGFLVGTDQVLTCAHVVTQILGEKETVQSGAVAGRRVLLDFPHLPAAGPLEAEVLAEGWAPPEEDYGDIAVLRLAHVPESAVPAPLRRPPTLDGHRFSVHGFPLGPGGGYATGILRGRRGPHGRWVQMEDVKTEGAAITEGFSGCPVWDVDLEAVVGTVVSKYQEEGAKIGSMIPVEEIERVWMPLSAWVRWRLDLDPQAETHWLPRARGVPLGESDGWFFIGRHRLLAELSEWLRQPPGADRSIRLITGRAGSGKSAALARLVVLSDPVLGPEVPVAEPDRAVAPPLRAVDVAVHCRGKTADQVAAELAAAADVLAASTDELMVALRTRRRPFTVVVDAPEEAASGHDRAIVSLLAKLAAHPSGQVRVAVGIRTGSRSAIGSLLVDLLGHRVVTLPLDDPEYLDREDLIAYAFARLHGASGGDHPYRLDEELARSVAAAVAARADPLFLVAQLTCQALILQPVDTGRPGWEDHLPSDVDLALGQYMERFGDRERTVRELFTALAYAEGGGLPEGALWADLATALSLRRIPYREADVYEVLESAASFLVEDQAGPGQPRRFQLFHGEMVAYFRSQRPEREAQGLLCDALLRRVPLHADGTRDWSAADWYVVNHLASHAAPAGRLGSLLDDTGYLVAAEPGPLLSALSRVRPLPSAGKAYQAARHRLDRIRPGDRAAYLGLAARTLGDDPLAERLDALPLPRPWSVRWAHSRRVPAHLTIGRHLEWVNAVAVTGLGDRLVAVSAGEDGSVRVWDLAAGQLLRSLGGGTGSVYALAVTGLGDRTVAVTGSTDRSVRVWDLVSGRAVGVPLQGHGGPVWAVATGELGGRLVAVSGGEDGLVRVWDLVSGRAVGVPLEGHFAPVYTVVVAAVGARTIAVTGSKDRSVRAWDLADQDGPVVSLRLGAGRVDAVAVGTVAGRAVAVTGAEDGSVLMWDLTSGAPVGPALVGHVGGVRAVAVGSAGDRAVAVSGGSDRTVRVPLGAPRRHADPVRALAVAAVGERLVAVSGSDDGTVRVSDLAGGVTIATVELDVPVSAVALATSGAIVVAHDRGHLRVDLAGLTVPRREPG